MAAGSRPWGVARASPAVLHACCILATRTVVAMAAAICASMKGAARLRAQAAILGQFDAFHLLQRAIASRRASQGQQTLTRR